MFIENNIKLEKIERNNVKFSFHSESDFAVSDGIALAAALDESVIEAVNSALQRFESGDYGGRNNKRNLNLNDLAATYPISIAGNLVEDGIHCYLCLHPKFGLLLLLCLSYES